MYDMTQQRKEAIEFYKSVRLLIKERYEFEEQVRNLQDIVKHLAIEVERLNRTKYITPCG